MTTLRFAAGTAHLLPLGQLASRHCLWQVLCGHGAHAAGRHVLALTPGTVALLRTQLSAVALVLVVSAGCGGLGGPLPLCQTLDINSCSSCCHINLRSRAAAAAAGYKSPVTYQRQSQALTSYKSITQAGVQPLTSRCPAPHKQVSSPS
jgi:hypothetical protein